MIAEGAFMGLVDRRKFLTLAGASAAAMGIGALTARRARAGWGDFQDPLIVWPGGVPDIKVLEVFLYGGLSPWETFYHRPDLSDPWLGFSSEVGSLSWACASAPSNSTATQEFAVDGAGQAVHLGPFTAPFWRPDILSRLRIIVLQHDLEPHEAAIPLALTGHRLGRPNLAGMGALIQRYWQEQQPRPLPYSYVCVPQSTRFPSDNLQASFAVGPHGGRARPLVLRLGPGTDDLLQQLPRNNTNFDAAGADELLNLYRTEYRSRLRWRGQGDPIRSKAFVSYDASAETLTNAQHLEALLTGSNVDLNLRMELPCPALSSQNPPLGNVPGTGIRAAAALLSASPAQAPRYVCVIDSGHQEHSMGGGYDTHSSDHVQFTAMNLRNTLSTLADIIQDPTQPPAGSKIDLDSTLVILTTEFGRTPQRTGDGRDHWPGGYVSVLLGGPITSAGLVGTITPSHVADIANAHTPTDLRAAATLAAGIDPFADGNFGVGDISEAVRDPGSEDGTSVLLRQQILGIV
jgi:hypothetical protein